MSPAILALALTLLAAPRPLDVWKAHVERADRAFASGQFEKAAADYLSALDLELAPFPDAVLRKTVLALSRMPEGLEKATTVREGRLSGYQLRMMGAMDRGDYTAARRAGLDLRKRLIEHDRGDLEALAPLEGILAFLSHVTQDPRAARQHLDRWRKGQRKLAHADPMFGALAMVGAALTNLEDARRSRAEELLKRALDILERSANGHPVTILVREKLAQINKSSSR